MPTSNLVTEAELTQTIIGMARAYGWLVFHDRDSRRSEPGFPDLVAVSQAPMRPRVLFLEIKTAKGRLTKGRESPRTGRWLPGQEDWIGALQRCNTLGPASEGSRVETYVARPEHLDELDTLFRS